MEPPSYLRIHQPLVGDLKAWSRALKGNLESQRLRRAYTHSAISYIEAACFGIKQGLALMQDELLAKGAVPIFTFAELAMLREVRPCFDKNRVEADYVMPQMSANVRFTFQSVKRAFGLDWNVPEGECWKRLSRIKNVRNRIAHPKRPEDLNVADDELEEIEEAAAWFGTTHEDLDTALRAKVARVKEGKDFWPGVKPE